MTAKSPGRTNPAAGIQSCLDILRVSATIQRIKIPAMVQAVGELRPHAFIFTDRWRAPVRQVQHDTRFGAR